MKQQNQSRHHYLGLLAGLLAIFILSPFFESGSIATSLLSIAFLMTLFFSVMVISSSKKIMVLSLILATPLVVESLRALFTATPQIDSLFLTFCNIGFVCLIIAVMLRDMFISTKVDQNLIIGSISLYLLLGLFWGFIYLAIHHTFPGSFHFQYKPMESIGQIGDLMYYSMVTLTTLGYGDITPVSAQARAVAATEAVSGQIYLTVLVARLVGMHIAQK